jgi:Tfp pilus assembly protein PilN
VRPVNLLPAEYRRDRLEVFKSPPTPVLALGLAGVVVVAMLVGGFIVENSKVSDKRRTLDSLQTELSATPGPRQRSSHEAELLQSRDQRVATLNTALTGRIAWDRVLRNLSSVLPDDVWLSSLKAGASTGAESTPAASGAASTAGEDFVLNGYAYSQDGVARLLARLEVVPDLSDVQLQKSEKTEVAGRPVVTFAVEAAVRPPGASP